MQLYRPIFASLLVLFLFSCDEAEDQGSQIDLPEDIVVEVPDGLTSGSSGARLMEDGDLSGGQIYFLLTVFVELAEESSTVVQNLLYAIERYNLTSTSDITYTSDDDNRQKHLFVRENYSYENVNYDYVLTVEDVESGNIGLQMFWNPEAGEQQGVVIFDLFEFDRANNADSEGARIQIEFGETDANYDKYMIVSIDGFPLDVTDEFSVDNLKVFVGKTGDIVDVYGNTNHPLSQFHGAGAGMNWAFVASGDVSSDIAVAELGLPAGNNDSSDRTVLLEDNSIYAVLSALILSQYPNASQDLIDLILADTEAPGYFQNEGFVGAGTSPGIAWDVHSDRIDNLTPYKPTDIRDLSIEFTSIQ